MGQFGPRGQAVSLIELFYDLMYVYAIAKMASIFAGAGLVPSLVADMCAAVFMSNAISEDWGEMLVMLGTVAALYALHLREGKSERDLAKRGYSLFGSFLS